MTRLVRLFFRAGLFAGLLLTAQDALAQSGLGGTSWKASDDCFLSRIDFKTDGTVQVSFDNGDLDVGEWEIGEVIVRIMLDKYADYFLGTYKDDSLKLGHVWIAPDDVPDSEVCSFSKA